jgi:hypothetical protein
MGSKVLFVAVAVLFVATATGEIPEDVKVSRSDEVSHYKVLDKVSVPHLINYQGYLTDNAGNPIDGTLQMTFSIWDAASGGTQLWSETQASVAVINGLFNVLLGSVNPIPPSIFDGTPLWLQTQVGTEVLSPRKAIVSVAHAFRASAADAADYAEEAGHADTTDFAWMTKTATYANASDYADSTGYAHDAKRADSSGYAVYADSAGTSGPAAYAESAGVAGYAHDAGHADSSNYSTYAYSAGVTGSAAYADSAGVAGYAHDAGHADSSDYADYADSAGVTDQAAYAGSAAYAGQAAYAESAGVAGYAHNATCADTAGHWFVVDSLTLPDLDDRYVNEGQWNSITEEMIHAAAVTQDKIKDGSITWMKISKGHVVSYNIRDSTIVDEDISPAADIDPEKIKGTAWTSTNDGAGSGLDADKLDGFHASHFATVDSSYTKSEADARFINDGQGEINAANDFKFTSSTYIKNLDADKLDGLDATAFFSIVNDFGRSGVASNLYEGTTKLTDKYVNEGQANSVTSDMIVDGTIQQADLSFNVPDGHSLDAADGSPTDVVYVDNEGKVGIGTTTPTRELDVHGVARIQGGGELYLEEMVVGLASHIHLINTTRTWLIDSDSDPDGFHIIEGEGGPRRLTILPGGDVGIGTETPSEKLDVDGNIHASGTVTSGSSITIDGTANPGTITESHGKISFDDDDLATTGNVEMGGFKLTTSPSTGYVLTSDATGAGTWQAAAGDITAVTADTGLSGGGTSGDVTLKVMVPLELSGSVASNAIIKGTNNGTGWGVYGQGRYGVYGDGDDYGVYGKSDVYGVLGRYGDSGPFGYLGSSNCGTYGQGGTFGVWGHSSVTAGVWGSHDSGNYGYLGTNNYGVYGHASSGSDTAGYFDGDVHMNGDLSITSNTLVTNLNADLLDGQHASAFALSGHTHYWTYSGGKLYPNNTTDTVLIGTTSTNWIKPARLTVDANDAWYGVLSEGNIGSVAGVKGEANGATYGVYGEGSSDEVAGVYGRASGADYGVYGRGSLFEIAGVYGEGYGADYGVKYSGGLGGSGTKSAVVRTSKGPTEMYAMESPELWFEDFGSARLTNGRAYITLDSQFLETVTIDTDNPMKVFVQLNDDCNGVYVKKGVDGFEVIELQGGTSNASFDYRVLAKRKGYETQRMKVTESCYMDKFLYPDDNDPDIPLEWKEKRQKQREDEEKIKESLK